MNAVLICFPSRGNWFAKEQWICPLQVASLVPGYPDYPNNTSVTLSGGGTIHLWDYPIAETARMLGFARKEECPHGHSGIRCDECYADAIADRSATAPRRETGVARKGESGGAGTAIAQGQVMNP